MHLNRSYLIGVALLAPLCGSLGYAQDVSKEEKADGFASLFNGKDLTGWMGDTDGFGVDDGVIFSKKTAKAFKNLLTKDTYADFILRLDYLVTENNNNGVGVRVDPKMTGANVAYKALEIQICDEVHAKLRKYTPVQKTGSVYGLVAAKQGVQKEPDKWNTMEIVAKGPLVTVTINGTQVVSTDTVLGAPEGKRHEGLKRTNGHIAFLAHTGRTEFKNIRIKSLTK